MKKLFLLMFLAGSARAGSYYDLTQHTSSTTLKVAGEIKVAASSATTNTTTIHLKGPTGGVEASSAAFSAGVFSVGGSTLITRNGLVGIRTNNPLAPLHIVSTSAAGFNRGINLRTLVPTSVGDGVYIELGASNTDGEGPQLGGIRRGGGFVDFIIKTGVPQSERIRVTESGDIGVGTAAPGAKFHVSGGSIAVDGTGAKIKLSSGPLIVDGAGGIITVSTVNVTGGGGVNIIFGMTAGTGTIIGNSFTVGTSSFVVTGSRIGIRTASPVYALDVAGDARIGSQLIVGSSGSIAGNFSVGPTTAPWTSVYDSTFQASGGLFTVWPDGAAMFRKPGGAVACTKPPAGSLKYCAPTNSVGGTLQVASSDDGGVWGQAVGISVGGLYEICRDGGFATPNCPFQARVTDSLSRLGVFTGDPAATLEIRSNKNAATDDVFRITSNTASTIFLNVRADGVVGIGAGVSRSTFNADGSLVVSSSVTAAQFSGDGTNLTGITRSSYTTISTTTFTNTTFTVSLATVSLTTRGGLVIVSFVGTVVNDANNLSIQSTFLVDGAPPTEYGTVMRPTGGGAAQANDPFSVGFSYPLEGLSAGAHTFSVALRIESGTGTLFFGNNGRPKFGVMEIR